MFNHCVHIAAHNFAPVISHQLNFSRPGQEICLNISIVDNTVVEERKVHNFTVELHTGSDLVSVGHPAVVQIIDNDCEYHTSYNMQDVLKFGGQV